MSAPVLDLREIKERRFVHLMIIFTIRDAFDLSEWYMTGEYKSRFYYQFGFRATAPREKAWNRVSERIKAWVDLPIFERLCKAAGGDVASGRSMVLDLLDCRGDREYIKQLLNEHKEELSLYAKRGRRPKEKGAEASKTNVRPIVRRTAAASAGVGRLTA